MRLQILDDSGKELGTVFLKDAAEAGYEIGEQRTIDKALKEARKLIAQPLTLAVQTANDIRAILDSPDVDEGFAIYDKAVARCEANREEILTSGPATILTRLFKLRMRNTLLISASLKSKLTLLDVEDPTAATDSCAT